MTERVRVPGSRRRHLLALVMLIATTIAAVGGLSGGAVASAAPAQTSPTPTSPTVSMPSIIPQPNSGAEPKTGTDRGGWVQWVVMGGMIVALGIIVLLVRRESHRKRAILAATNAGSTSQSSAV